MDGAIARAACGVWQRFDPTLANALERSAKKIPYQMAKMERKAGREALRRDERAAPMRRRYTG